MLMAFQRSCQKILFLSSMHSKKIGNSYFKNVIEGRNYIWNLYSRYMCECSDKKRIVAIPEAKRYIIDIFKAVEMPDDYAIQMADFMVGADYRGHISHGMNRLEMYLEDLSSNSTDMFASPQILQENSCTAWVHGCNGLGIVVGNFCMQLAIKKAKDVGVGWVCAKGSNHYGLAGWFSTQAIKEGMLGISMTNTPPLLAPTRGKVAVLGTNPISLGARAKDDMFLLDMATSAVAMGKIEIQRRKGEPLLPGWALDSNGNETTDADEAFKASILLPLGGSENNSGFKGYGLAALVDVLTGVLAGANYANKMPIVSQTDAENIYDVGHVFIAVDPNCFAPDFEDRLKDFNSRLRNCEPVDPKRPVMVPGDAESDHMKAADKAGGIEYLPNQLKTCADYAQCYNVKPLEFI